MKRPLPDGDRLQASHHQRMSSYHARLWNPSAHHGTSAAPGDLSSIRFDSRRIRDAFDALDNQLADAPEALFVAICSEDSSTVYYKISKGMIKPEV